MGSRRSGKSISVDMFKASTRRFWGGTQYASDAQYASSQSSFLFYKAVHEWTTEYIFREFRGGQLVFCPPRVVCSLSRKNYSQTTEYISLQTTSIHFQDFRGCKVVVCSVFFSLYS